MFQTLVGRKRHSALEERIQMFVIRDIVQVAPEYEDIPPTRLRPFFRAILGVVLLLIVVVAVLSI